MQQDEIERSDGVRVNAETVGIVMNVCSHCNQVDVATDIWEREIGAKLQWHCHVLTPYIDCLSRAGRNGEAFELIKEYELRSANSQRLGAADNHIMWIAVLSGCKKHEHHEMAQIVFAEYTKRI